MMKKYQFKFLLFKCPWIMSLGKMIKRVGRNIKFLFTENLYQASLNYDMDILKHEMVSELSHTKNPVVKSIQETFDMLINSECSFCRFGDGEFENILKKPVPFSNVCLEKLSQRLIEVLSSAHQNICIGVPLRMYEGKENLPSYERIFWRRPYIRVFYKLIETYCHFDKIYYAAEVTLPFCYQDTNLGLFFSKARQIWQGKDITIVAGKGIFAGLQYNIFDNAASIEFIDAPKKNAFSDYETILQKALNTDKKRLKIIILGQTATVLAYDLALQGHRALDLGHIAKSYDWYCQNKTGKNFSNVKFFLPD